MLPSFVWKREKYLMYQFSSPFLAKCTGFIPHPPSRRIMEEYIPLTWRWHAFLARATVGTSLYVSLCVSSSVPFCFCLHRATSYGVARLVEIAPLDCWRNSTRFLCKASFCTMKTDHLRPQLLTTQTCLTKGRNTTQVVHKRRGIYSPKGTGLFPQFFFSLTRQWKPENFEFLAQTPIIITFIAFLSYNFSKN